MLTRSNNQFFNYEFKFHYLFWEIRTNVTNLVCLFVMFLSMGFDYLRYSWKFRIQNWLLNPVNSTLLLLKVRQSWKQIMVSLIFPKKTNEMQSGYYPKCIFGKIEETINSFLDLLTFRFLFYVLILLYVLFAIFCK